MRRRLEPGHPLAYTRELAGYWADEYDWRAREAALNRFDQFVTEIDGLDIHFIHQRSSNPNAFPLIITHGWPGSIVEFHKVIEPLAADFHVVCPSLPGYGFSGKPRRTGWSVEKVADAWATLMARLGYESYGAQGGDWGSAVTAQMGRNGRGCKAIHINMPLGFPTPESAQNPTPRRPRRWRRSPAMCSGDRLFRGAGHPAADARVRPDRFPVGQLAWIVEKFWAWTDCDGHPENVLTRDEMLDNVMLYWATASATSSARLYWESFKKMLEAGPVQAPTGVAAFPKEIVPSPRSWCESRYHITHWTDMPRGGHFAAFEQPELFADDVRAFFG